MLNQQWRFSSHFQTDNTPDLVEPSGLDYHRAPSERDDENGIEDDYRDDKLNLLKEDSILDPFKI